jgi:exopolysaccharide biosynthesis polyprenyl glycosylphosphotransferase
MLHQQREVRDFVAQLLDAALLGGSLWAAHAIRFSAGENHWFNLPTIQPIQAFYPLLVFSMFLGPFILDSWSIYRHSLFDGFRSFSTRLGQSLLVLFTLMILLIYFFRIGDLARGVVVLFVPIAFMALSFRHFWLQGWIDTFVHGKAGSTAVLLVGDRSGADEFRKLVESQRDLKMTVVGIIQELHDLEREVSEWLHRAPITGVIFNVSRTGFDEIQKAVNVCELEGVEAWVVTDYIKSEISKPAFEHFHGHPMLVFAPKELPEWQIIAKRLLDFSVALVGLVLLAPLLTLIAWIIRLESPGPPLFVQDRSGSRGRVFRMYKFRSMESNAAMRQAELETFNEMKGPVFKISKDPRVTKFGAFLRRTSLDELPQLWNVLVGDMSLVGPRPLPVYETQKIFDWAHRRRLSVKPGLTCLWQIAGRNKIHDFNDWVRLDLEYVDNHSFWLDLKILLKTIPVVLGGWGAR